MYKIAYIDENINDIHNFQDYVKYSPSSHVFELDVMEPEPNLDEFVIKLIENHYKAFVIDFDLQEKNSQIKYDGWDLAEKILAIRDNFPVFILTSFEEKALNDTEDVNIVYEKNKIVHEEDQGFLEKIKLQIGKYDMRIERAERRILTLISAKKNRELTYEEENELIEKNIFIEKSLNKTASIPKDLQSLSGEKHLDDILSVLQKIDIELQQYNKNKK